MGKVKIDWEGDVRKSILDMFGVTEEEVAALDEEQGFGEAHRQAKIVREVTHRHVALISDEIAQQIAEQFIKPVSIGFGLRREYPPLTRRQRMRYRLSRLRWSIHDRMFPECREYDE